MKHGKLHRDHVLKAIAEFDKKGEDDFLDEYDYGHAREYLLFYEGNYYPSKAICGVAYKFAPPLYIPKKASEFNGGKGGAAGQLVRLGFEIHPKKS